MTDTLLRFRKLGQAFCRATSFDHQGTQSRRRMADIFHLRNRDEGGFNHSCNASYTTSYAKSKAKRSCNQGGNFLCCCPTDMSTSLCIAPICWVRNK